MPADRVLLVAAGWMALALLVPATLLLAFPRTRARALRSWWLITLSGAIVLAAVGVSVRLWFVVASAVVLSVGAAWEERRGVYRREHRHGGGWPAGTFGLYLGIVMLATAALAGVPQTWSLST